MTFNYNLDALGNCLKKCSCDSPNCSGFIGVPPKRPVPPIKEKRNKKKRRKKKSLTSLCHLRKHEDSCYHCGDGGDLVLCDHNNCPKCYHKECVELHSVPKGKWICGWHFCDICGKSVSDKGMCQECPNSFCSDHLDGNIVLVPDPESDSSKVFCTEHEDLIGQVLTDGTDTSTACNTPVPNDIDILPNKNSTPIQELLDSSTATLTNAHSVEKPKAKKAKQPKEPKGEKQPKSRQPKQPKEPKKPKQPKEPKQPVEQKQGKEPKKPKEKKPREPKTKPAKKKAVDKEKGDKPKKATKPKKEGAGKKGPKKPVVTKPDITKRNEEEDCDSDDSFPSKLFIAE